MRAADERFQECDALIDTFEDVTKHPIVAKSQVYYTVLILVLPVWPSMF